MNDKSSSTRVSRHAFMIAVCAALTVPVSAWALGRTLPASSAAEAGEHGHDHAAHAHESVAPESDLLPAFFDDTLLGRSGKLRMRRVAPQRSMQVPALVRLFGDSASRRAGVYTLNEGGPARGFSFITMRPFSDKQAGRIGAYRIGTFPFERRARAGVTLPGFIEVTRENQDLQVSEHFRLRDFLTKDQQNVWPKYLVLDEKLLDKLELIIDELKKDGIPVKRMVVMSGFRTPQYNVQGVGKGGRANDSRHQYGDAADVFVDNNGNGRMDDLNGDGVVDHRDAQVIMRAAERVERRYPELTGGIGVYRANSAHGPFAHVDVRGSSARWGVL